jgi:hypothetical protein
MDILNLPNKSLYHKVFHSSTSTNWQIWTKPANIKFVYMYVIGAGGAGGGGRTGGNNGGGGGGGGGSSSITTVLYPAFLLPDTLYINVGVGPTNAAAGTGGASGALSYVSIRSSTSPIFIVAQSGNVAAGGGGGGTNSGVGSGAAGVAGTAWTFRNFPLSSMGIINSIAGQAGGAGGQNTPTAGTTITPTLPVTGGAGGGGVSISGANTRAGGNITGSGFLPSILGGSADGSTVTLIGGKVGFMGIKPTTESYLNLPMMYTGGSGGGSKGVTAAVGGRGGDGSYGSGGGGGGASYASTGGSSGRGGDGLVIITCW